MGPTAAGAWPVVDLAAWTDCIAAFERLLSLASMLPVITAARSLAHGRVLPPSMPRAGDAPDSKEEEGERQAGAGSNTGSSSSASGAAAPAPGVTQEGPLLKKEGAGSSSEADDPLGMLSILLFMASEAISAMELFRPVAAAGAKNGKTAAPRGPLPAIMAAIRKGTRPTKKKPTASGLLSQALAVATEILSDAAVFEAVHGVLMLLALWVVLASLLSTNVFGFANIGNRVFGYPSTGRSSSSSSKSFGGVMLGFPIVLWMALRTENLAKVWRALVSEKLATAAQLPLRVASLLLATPPTPAKESETLGQSGEAIPRQGPFGTPGLFTALQVGCYVTRITHVVASGRASQMVAAFQSNPSAATLVDSEVLSVLVPILIALLWASYVHLHRRPGSAVLAMLLTGAASPGAVGYAWPLVASRLGVAGKPPQAVLKVFTTLYAFTGLGTFLCGGSFTIIGVMLGVQLLVKMHGMEMFSVS